MGKDEFLLRYEDKLDFEEQEELAAVRKLEEESLKALKPVKKPRKRKVDSKVAKTDTKPSEGFKGLETGFDMPDEELMFLEKSTRKVKSPAKPPDSITATEAQAAVKAVVASRKK